MPVKKRLDILLVEKKLAESRTIARAYIMERRVKVNGDYITKPGKLIPVDAEISIELQGDRYVSRGGIKLKGALDYWNIEVKDKVILDAGASTGGFTDCLLKRGAKRVYAVDVGYGQLHWSLRKRKDVIIKEKYNIRYANPEDFPELMDMVVADLSFISLTKVLPALVPLVREGGMLLLLVKPQFELERKFISKGGIVKEDNLRLLALEKVKNKGIELGLKYIDHVDSIIPGPKGNREIFILFMKSGGPLESSQ